MGRLSYSQTFPSALILKQRERVAKQILACLRYISAKPLQDQYTLDLGASNGVIDYYLAAFVKNIIGIDVDAIAIQDGKKRFHRKNLLLKHFDGRKIPYKNNTFDVVIFRRSYQYIDHLEKIIEEVYRVLKPDGICYFEGTNKLSFLGTDYNLPLLAILPKRISKIYVETTKQRYFSAKYLTYWMLKKHMRLFRIYSLSSQIMKHPKKFSFMKLYWMSKMTKLLPLWVLQLLEPMYPHFIWILKK